MIIINEWNNKSRWLKMHQYLMNNLSKTEGKSLLTQMKPDYEDFIKGNKTALLSTVSTSLELTQKVKDDIDSILNPK